MGKIIKSKSKNILKIYLKIALYNVKWKKNYFWVLMVCPIMKCVIITHFVHFKYFLSLIIQKPAAPGVRKKHKLWRGGGNEFLMPKTITAAARHGGTEKGAKILQNFGRRLIKFKCLSAEGQKVWHKMPKMQPNGTKSKIWFHFWKIYSNG